ncbi:LEPR-XLL domain-containing protein [Aquabacterium sp.]|uniref:LEPR-XLL domain-containing protein n=1 Tax=Aquabacterium sp. TaxID=1872578 RepID=UPI0035B30CB7
MPIRPTPRSLRREPPRVEELEPRVLFSADLAALVDTSSAGLLADSATATAREGLHKASISVPARR